MKKNIVFLVMCVFLLPNCGGGKKTTVKTGNIEGTVILESERNTPKKGKKGLFVDDSVAQFDLEEENNSFSASAFDNSAQLKLVDSPQVAEWEARKAEQAKYGLKTIYFNFDQYEIRPDQDVALKHNAQVVKKLVAEGKQVVIEGHACNSAGDENYNLHLSEKRAQAVRQALNKFGVPMEKMKTVGRGSEMRVVSHGTREQQGPNRRIEIYNHAEAA